MFSAPSGRSDIVCENRISAFLFYTKTSFPAFHLHKDSRGKPWRLSALVYVKRVMLFCGQGKYRWNSIFRCRLMKSLAQEISFLSVSYSVHSFVCLMFFSFSEFLGLVGVWDPRARCLKNSFSGSVGFHRKSFQSCFLKNIYQGSKMYWSYCSLFNIYLGNQLIKESIYFKLFWFNHKTYE